MVLSLLELEGNLAPAEKGSFTIFNIGITSKTIPQATRLLAKFTFKRVKGKWLVTGVLNFLGDEGQLIRFSNEHIQFEALGKSVYNNINARIARALRSHHDIETVDLRSAQIRNDQHTTEGDN